MDTNGGTKKRPVALVLIREYGIAGMRTSHSQLYFSLEEAEQVCRRRLSCREFGRQMFVFGKDGHAPKQVRSYDSEGRRTDECDEETRDANGWNVEDAVFIVPKTKHACSPVFVEHPAVIARVQPEKAVVYVAEPGSHEVRFQPVSYCCLRRRALDTSNVVDMALQAVVQRILRFNSGKRSSVVGEDFLVDRVMNGGLRADLAGALIQLLRDSRANLKRGCGNMNGGDGGGI